MSHTHKDFLFLFCFMVFYFLLNTQLDTLYFVPNKKIQRFLFYTLTIVTRTLVFSFFLHFSTITKLHLHKNNDKEENIVRIFTLVHTTACLRSQKRQKSFAIWPKIFYFKLHPLSHSQISLNQERTRSNPKRI